MPSVRDRDRIIAHVRIEISRRVRPDLLRLANNPHCGQDLAKVFVDILETMIKKDDHEQ